MVEVLLHPVPVPVQIPVTNANVTTRVPGLGSPSVPVDPRVSAVHATPAKDRGPPLTTTARKSRRPSALAVAALGRKA